MILKMLQLKEELLYINAGGDGLDSNGDVVMTGGTIVIDGPEDSANGAIDYESSFDMSGGEIIAAGSSGMAMTSSSTSAINSVNITFSTTYSNTEIIIKDSNGIYLTTYGFDKSNYNNIYNNTIKSSAISEETGLPNPSAWAYGVHIMGDYNKAINNTIYLMYRGVDSEGSFNEIIGNNIFP